MKMKGKKLKWRKGVENLWGGPSKSFPAKYGERTKGKLVGHPNKKGKLLENILRRII